MAKTADVLQAIWADPWFLHLTPDGKLLFLWGITNEHANFAGLYVVAEETIRHETKFSTNRLSKALEDVHPKMGYRPETGTVCIPSRPKYVRTKNRPAALSVAYAIRDCLHPEIAEFYLRKYASNAWLGPVFDELALQAENFIPQRGMAIPHSHSHSQKEEQKRSEVRKTSAPDPDRLPTDFDLRLATAAKRCLPVLQRTAESRGAKPVTLLAVARAVESYPRKDHFAVAGNVEHWLVHGTGAKQRPKDVVARFRNFLDSSEDVANPSPAGSNGRRTDPALAKITGRRA